MGGVQPLVDAHRASKYVGVKGVLGEDWTDYTDSDLGEVLSQTDELALFDSANKAALKLAAQQVNNAKDPIKAMLRFSQMCQTVARRRAELVSLEIQRQKLNAEVVGVAEVVRFCAALQAAIERHVKNRQEVIALGEEVGYLAHELERGALSG